MGWLNALFRPWRRLPSELSPARLRVLEKRLGYHFGNPALLVHALKHRSFVYANQGRGLESNERLEFLGDAVLDLVVAESLFRRFPDQREGNLTQSKSVAVSRAVLARRAGDLGLEEFVLLSQEERQSSGGRQPSILSDAFEAVIGAMYLDGGLEPCRRFIERMVLQELGQVIADEEHTNFKSKLLEHTQGLGAGHPKYQVSSEEGPEHCKIFSVEVSVTGRMMGQGRGLSKKEAQQMAAKDALQRLGAL
ncbi:MAG: ribonuclease III [Candidatus Handelsmanbacteria bacterium]|nr:ribonuclease III [Candidatus Handelsmanbacteria bacterium]